MQVRTSMQSTTDWKTNTKVKSTGGKDSSTLSEIFITKHRLIEVSLRKEILSEEDFNCKCSCFVYYNSKNSDLDLVLYSAILRLIPR